MTNKSVSNVWDQVKGSWTQARGEIRKKWGEFTDDEIEQMKGDRDIMSGMIQKKYGQTKEEVNTQIDDWANKLKLG